MKLEISSYTFSRYITRSQTIHYVWNQIVTRSSVSEIYSEPYLLIFNVKINEKSRIFQTASWTIDILKVRTFHIDTNITSKAFYNSKPSNAIYELAISNDPDLTIDETP